MGSFCSSFLVMFDGFDVKAKRGRQKTETRIPAGAMEELDPPEMHRCAALFQVLEGEGRI